MAKKLILTWPSYFYFTCSQYHLQSNEIVNLKLKNEYKDRESEIGKWLKLFFGLPFLPSETVSDVFANVLMLEASPLPEVQRFCDYMLDTYIAPDARFPPEMWAASPNESAIRTKMVPMLSIATSRSQLATLG